MKSILVAAALMASTLSALAQGLPTLDDVKKVTDAAMSKVGKGDIEGGLRTFKPLSIVPSAEFDVMISQAALQLPGMTAKFGDILGYEFIREDRLGESLARYIYIHRFEKHAMRWVFYLYKGKDGWVVNTFRTDEKWDQLF
jgi:hypothetical protein